MSIRKFGEEEYDNFRNERLLKKEKGFHDPIKNNNLKLFSSGNRKIQTEQSSARLTTVAVAVAVAHDTTVDRRVRKGKPSISARRLRHSIKTTSVLSD